MTVICKFNMFNDYCELVLGILAIVFVLYSPFFFIGSPVDWQFGWNMGVVKTWQDLDWIAFAAGYNYEAF